MSTKRQAKVAARGLVSGLGALASIWPASPVVRYPHASVMEALRGDFRRIGSDLNDTIEREREGITEEQKQPSREP